MSEERLAPSQRKVLELLRSYESLSPSEISELTGYPENAVRRRITDLREKGYNIETIKVGDEYRYVLIEYDDIPVSLARRMKRYGVTKKVRAFLNELLEDAKRAREEIEQLPPPDVMYTKDGESLVIVNSDLHIGKRVEDEDGTVLYNVEIAKRRFRKLNENLFKLIRHIVQASEIEEIIIIDVGDTIDGEQIYGTQYAHIEALLPKQIHIATEEKWRQIEYLRKHFQVPIFYWSVYGNHGRPPHPSIAEASNFDTVVQLNLEVLRNTLGYDDVYIDNSYADIAIRTLRNKWRIFMKHECPPQPETPAARSMFGGWLSMYNYDAIVTGHWHRYMICEFQGRPILYNGSLVGVDEYARRLARYSNPTQLVFGACDKRLPTFLYMVDLR